MHFFVVLMFSLPLIASESALKRADRIFSQRSDAARAREALGLYRELAKGESPSTDVLWRLSMACQYLGMRVETDTELRRDLFTEGSEAAKSALNNNPECVPCHFWYAVNRALYADNVGVLKMLFSVGEIQYHLEQAASRDPSYALGGPYRVLGVIQQRLPGIFGGSHDRAKALFGKAIEAAPEEPMNYELLAKHVHEHDENPRQALEIALRGLRVSRATTGVPESEQAARALQIFSQELTSVLSTQTEK